MNGITELAMLFKSCKNGAAYSPVFGRIASLPDLKITIGDKITLNSPLIKRLIDVNQQDENGQYVYLNREVVLLPYAANPRSGNGQKFILIGGVFN